MPGQADYSRPPDGYEPVFINYVGRHGARSQTSTMGDSILFTFLELAEKENGLSLQGKQLKLMDSLLMGIQKENVASITELGQEEQQGIGFRMKKNFKSVFESGKGFIQVSTTKKERTRQSARAFLQGLQADSSMIHFNLKDSDNLAFYDISPAYKAFKRNGNWKDAYAKVRSSEPVKLLIEKLPGQFLEGQFLTSFLADSVHLTGEDDQPFNAEALEGSVFDICSIIPSLTYEIKKAGIHKEDMDYSRLVSCSDLNQMTFINSAEDFLLKGPGTNTEGIQLRIAIPLLVSFIRATDDFIDSGKVYANLRFAHAETIAPFAALLGISGASEAINPNQIQSFDKIWKCENIIPLSANIQWILYKNPVGKYLVKIMLNERESKINGLQPTANTYYYNWQDLRKYYLDKLQKMNAGLYDNMHDYLMKVN